LGGVLGLRIVSRSPFGGGGSDRRRRGAGGAGGFRGEGETTLEWAREAARMESPVRWRGIGLGRVGDRRDGEVEAEWVFGDIWAAFGASPSPGVSWEIDGRRGRGGGPGGANNCGREMVEASTFALMLIDVRAVPYREPESESVLDTSSDS